eukprot:SAG11_NODE_697_length_7684_cov_8.250231_12_plen_158_part_00
MSTESRVSLAQNLGCRRNIVHRVDVISSTWSEDRTDAPATVHHVVVQVPRARGVRVVRPPIRRRRRGRVDGEEPAEVALVPRQVAREGQRTSLRAAAASGVSGPAEVAVGSQRRAGPRPRRERASIPAPSRPRAVRSCPERTYREKAHAEHPYRNER